MQNTRLNDPPMTAAPETRLELAEANLKDADAFCRGAFGPFVSDVSQYIKIVADLMQHATDRALNASATEPAGAGLREALEEWVAQGYIDADGEHCGSAAYAPALYEKSVAALALSSPPSPDAGASTREENSCSKIFDHKWLDPNCVENGCQSLASPAGMEGRREEMVAVPRAALNWLFGEGPDADGKHFGEREIRGRFIGLQI